jgi:hypothetical protein
MFRAFFGKKNNNVPFSPVRTKARERANHNRTMKRIANAHADFLANAEENHNKTMKKIRNAQAAFLGKQATVSNAEYASLGLMAPGNVQPKTLSSASNSLLEAALNSHSIPDEPEKDDERIEKLASVIREDRKKPTKKDIADAMKNLTKKYTAKVLARNDLLKYQGIKARSKNLPNSTKTVLNEKIVALTAELEEKKLEYILANELLSALLKVKNDYISVGGSYSRKTNSKTKGKTKRN